MDHFLKALKPYHDAGFINALGVVALFSVVLVALLPHFLRWLRRPKLQVAIPGNYFAPRQDFSNEQTSVYTIAALFVLRNAGRSDASRIRAVATDFYKFLPGQKGNCEHVRSSQHALEGSEIDVAEINATQPCVGPRNDASQHPKLTEKQHSWRLARS